MNLGQFRELTKDLPDTANIMYHAYYKGCCLHAYTQDDIWMYPKGKPAEHIVLNPGDDYDGRKPPTGD